jgi:hypothetical protein
MEHIKSLPKVEGLVPIYIRYGIRYILISVSGHQFSLEIIIDK